MDGSEIRAIISQLDEPNPPSRARANQRLDFITSWKLFGYITGIYIMFLGLILVSNVKMQGDLTSRGTDETQ